jgi:F0F1-type ATP synthase alpha subunit
VEVPVGEAMMGRVVNPLGKGASVAKSKPSICFLIKSLISLAFNCITIPLLLFI